MMTNKISRLCKNPTLLIFVLALLTTLPAVLAAPVELSAKGALSTAPNGQCLIAFVFSIAPGHYLYKDSIKITISGAEKGELFFPEARFKLDALTGEKREVFENTAEIRYRFRLPASMQGESLRAVVDYQACTEQACLLPMSKNLEFTISGAGSTPAVTPGEPGGLPDAAGKLPNAVIKDPTVNEGDNDRLSTLLARWGFLGYYLAGLLLSLTPCIFPMIPITISVIGSRRGGSLEGFLRSLVYVSGLALTYAMLGLGAAMGGGAIGSAMQNPFVLSGVAILFFAMGLSMMDLFYIELPAFLQSGLSSPGKPGRGYTAVFVTGLAAGLVASPCVTPVLVGILLKIAAEGNLLYGFLKLFTFAWGLGSILIIVGTFSSALSALPRAGAWMVEVKKILGLLLMGAAFYYIKGALPLAWFTVAFAVFLIVVAVAAGATDSLSPETALYVRVKKAGGITALVVGIYLLGGTLATEGLFLPPLLNCSIPAGSHSPAGDPGPLNWTAADEAAIAGAQKRRRPIMLDFGAEWCASCRKLKEITLEDESVRRELKRFEVFYVDMTRPTPRSEKLRLKYGVMGFPTLVFIDRKGKIRKDLTSVGFIEAPALLELLGRL